MPHITDSPGDFLTMDRESALRSASRTEGTHAIANQMANVERIQAANLSAILSSTTSGAAVALRALVLSNDLRTIGQFDPANHGLGDVPNSRGTASGASEGAAMGYGDPNPSYSKGGLTFTTTLTAQHVPGSQPTPRPFGKGPASPMGKDVAGRFIAGDVTVIVHGVHRANSGAVSFTVSGVTVTFPTTVYYNSSHWTYSRGAASIDTQYAENQHAIDFWFARDAIVIPMLERMITSQFSGRQIDAEAQIRREVLTILRRTNSDTVRRYDSPGGPHNGGSNPVPNGYPGFP